MEIKKTSLHKIDHRENVIVAHPTNEANNDLKDYIQELLKKIILGENKRRFKFVSDTTEIRSIIGKIMHDGDFSALTERSAKRLLEKEIKTQEQFGHLTELQKGMLFQTLITIDGSNKIIIAKADHNQYLDESDLSKKSGLPYDRKIYKGLLVEFGQDGEISNVRVYDTNAKISNYWWFDYLELTEEYTDAYNTESALEHITKELKRIEKKSLRDYNHLHNQMLGYFKSKETFDITEFVNQVIVGYEPEVSDIEINALERRIRALPETKHFDSMFGIDRKVTRGKKMKKIVSLLDNGELELHINGHIEGMSSVIQSILINGRKHIQIRSDHGYDVFEKNKVKK